MSDKVKENMEVIGADGVHVGTVDRVDGNRIKLKKRDSFGHHEGHHHYIEMGFVAGGFTPSSPGRMDHAWMQQYPRWFPSRSRRG